MDMAQQMMHQTPQPDLPEPGDRQPVDRKRRFRLVAVIVSYCLLISTGVVFAAFGGVVGTAYEALVELLVTALMGLATATTLAYITGSVVDYNGGVSNMIPRRRPRTYDPEAKG